MPRCIDRSLGCPKLIEWPKSASRHRDTTTPGCSTDSLMELNIIKPFKLQAISAKHWEPYITQCYDRFHHKIVTKPPKTSSFTRFQPPPPVFYYMFSPTANFFQVLQHTLARQQTSPAIFETNCPFLRAYTHFWPLTPFRAFPHFFQPILRVLTRSKCLSTIYNHPDAFLNVLTRFWSPQHIFEHFSLIFTHFHHSPPSFTHSQPFSLI